MTINRIDEIAEKRKWNIDNICTVKEEKTIVNKVNSVQKFPGVTAIKEFIYSIWNIDFLSPIRYTM